MRNWLLLLFFSTPALAGEDVSIAWSTIDSGGGLSSAATESVVPTTSGVPIEMTVTVRDPTEVVVVRPRLRGLAGRSGQEEWVLGQPLEVRAGDRLLATIDAIGVTVAAEQTATVNFDLTAGASDVIVTVTSAVVSFAAITNPLAFATFSAEVTDNVGDGATLTGMLADDAIYEGRYNVTSLPVTWASLATAPLVAPVDGSDSGTFRQPAVDRDVISATVDELQSAVSFELTAHDSANGTGTFSIVPPPAVILATGGTPQSTNVDTPFPNDLEATVLDADNEPVPDVLVTFTAPGAGASGTFPLGNTATTDASGIASVPFTANSVVGSYTVVATAAGSAEEAFFELQNLVGALAIPALGPWSLLVFVLVLAGSGFVVLMRRMH